MLRHTCQVLGAVQPSEIGKHKVEFLAVQGVQVFERNLANDQTWDKACLLFHLQYHPVAEISGKNMVPFFRKVNRIDAGTGVKLQEGARWLEKLRHVAIDMLSPRSKHHIAGFVCVEMRRL